MDAGGQDLQDTCVGNRYNIQQKLFSGFYGTCWKAVDREKGANVCIKTFFNEDKNQDKELKILAEFVEGHFHHENLCQVLEVALDKRPVHTSSSSSALSAVKFVSFEFCSGTDLFNFLVTGPYERDGRSNPFSEQLAHHYFTQVLLAVIYLHARGVYHRDIKPENCVLDHHFNLKLTDFGTNKIIHNQEMSKVLRTATHNIGTNCYRSPELNEKGKAYDPGMADVWSLGVTLFFFVGIEVMVHKCKQLDPYLRRMLAPLGIFFPFPVHCAKLESYMGTEREVSQLFNGCLDSPALKNKLFWKEWAELKAVLSKDLIDLFNRIFLLPPDLRITVSDMLNHPWMSSTPITQAQIAQEMKSRLPSSAECSPSPRPASLSYAATGGCDQTLLRRELLNTHHPYPSNQEVWPVSEGVRCLLSARSRLAEPDVQQSLANIGACQHLVNLLRERQTQPVTVPVKCRPAVAALLEAFGLSVSAEGKVLPQLPSQPALLDKAAILLDKAAILLEELDRALTSGIITCCPLSFDELSSSDVPTPTPSDMSDDVPTPTPSDVTTPVPDTVGMTNPFDKFTQLPSNESMVPGEFPSRVDSGQDTLPDMVAMEKLRIEPSAKPIDEKLPVAIKDGEDAGFTAAYEFAKLSMLLSSYGMRQKLFPRTLTAFCSVKHSSFFVQIVACRSTGSLHLFSDCFYGVKAWEATISQLLKDSL